MKQVSGQMSLFDLDMPCGRTYPAHSVPTKERTSASSSKSSAKSKTKAPMFLDLRTGSCNLAGVSWETGIQSLGASSMHAFGEFPSVVEESGLWQILEANVPQKYFLSARACAGVLRRAERRGKELPTILKTALEQQIERWEKYGTPMPIFMRETATYVVYDGENITSKVNASNPQIGDHCHTIGRTGAGRCYLVQIHDARGNGDGKIVPTITGDHNNRITDYTSLVCESYAENSSGDGIAGTIDSHYYLGCGARGGKEREFVAIKCFSQDAYDKYTETKQSATLKATGGVYGGGSEALVCAGFHPKAAKTASVSFRNGETPTLQSAKEVGVVYCLQGNGIDRADTAGCNGKGVKENESYTLNTVDRHAVCCEEKTIYIVRRLTPLECCRLQGMPDWWCADIPHSDAQEYRMWGNGMALPNALYIMEGLAKSEE